jgi:hypothetical protein
VSFVVFSWRIFSWDWDGFGEGTSAGPSGGGSGEGRARREPSVMLALKNDVHVHHFWGFGIRRKRAKKAYTRR